MFALQLLYIYYLIIESSHYNLSLESLYLSQYYTKGILELYYKFLITATALYISSVS